MTPERFAKLLQQLAARETEMVRAQNRWQRMRKAVRRAERKLDAQFAKRAAGDIGGKLDFRKLDS